MSEEQFSLVWNSFPRNLSSGLYTLLTDEQLVDVTLAAEGQILRAHKLILSVCSTYFRELFKVNSCNHPIVILKDVNYRDLSAMLHFMYQGEVNIKQEDIANFLKVAETLQIKGLTTATNENLEESLPQDVKDLNHILDVGHDKSVSIASDTNVQTLSNFSESLEDDMHLQIPNIPTDTVEERESFMEESIKNDTSHRQEPSHSIDYSAQILQSFSHKRYKNTEIQNSREEPLDCTSAISQVQNAKHEPLDYTVDINVEAGHKSYMSDKIHYRPEENMQRQDFVPDMQLVPHTQNTHSQPFGLSSIVTDLPNDLGHDIPSYSKGRRTVKGIPNNSLPLETTLRLVSELGPILRMERGKMMRMYSCPWCLRHFTRKENLKLHVRYIHGPLESLTCKLCGNKYKNSNSLRVHSYLYHNAKRDKHDKPLVNDDA